MANEPISNKPIDDFHQQEAKSKQPTPDEIEFVSKLSLIYEEAYAHREKESRNWDEYRRFVRGLNQWPARRPSYKVSALINFIPSNIERKAALLTDTKPKIEIKPRRSGLDDTCKILSKCIDAIWEEQEVPQKLVELAIQAQTFGSTFVNTTYDRDADGGRGDIDIVVRDPRSILVDPNVRRSYLLGKGEFVILEDVYPLAFARAMWPQRAHLMQPAPEFSTFAPVQRRGMLEKLVSFVWKPSGKTSELTSEIPRVIIREFWIRDRSKNGAGRAIYRNECRKCTLVNDVLVSDGENPFWDGNFPVDMLDWHMNFNTCFGWGDVELLKGPQSIINKLTATIIENALLMTNAIWIGDSDALDKKGWDRLTNEPGSTVRKRPGKELRREPGLPLPDALYRTIDLFKSYGIDEITGMVDVMRGLRTGQVESGVAIESLQLAAQSMIRLKARSMESLIKRIGQKLISRIFQYWDRDRVLNLVGGEEGLRQLEFLRSDLIRQHRGKVPDAFRDYQFIVVPGSSLAMSKMQKVMMATQLFQLGLIDELELLKTMEYPNAEKVAMDAQKRRGEMAAMQAGSKGGSKSNTSSFPFQVGGRGGAGQMG